MELNKKEQILKAFNDGMMELARQFGKVVGLAGSVGKILEQKEKLNQENELLLKLAEQNKKPLSPEFENLTPDNFIIKKKTGGKQ